MPAPVVYIVVAVVGAVAAGFAFKEFVFDPYLRPQIRQWREEQKARREAKKRSRQSISPHTIHEASSPLRNSPSTHEMVGLGSSATETGVLNRSLPSSASTGLRVRRSNAEPSNVEDVVIVGSGFMDLPNDNDIPITPLAPESNPWSGTSAPRSPTLAPSRSPFSVGSESPMTLSSPRSGEISLSASRASSSPVPPQIQLPTPSESEDEPMVPSSREVRLGLLESSGSNPFASGDSQLSTPSASSAVLAPQTVDSSLRPDLHAPSISRETTDMSASFFTAQSPPSEFRSLPATEPTSPFSESFTLSGDEDMYSFPSHSDSDESLPRFAAPEEERLRDDGLTFIVGNTPTREGRDELSDSLSDSSRDGSGGGTSDESWSDLGAPLAFPPHR